jgi:DNA-binding transcriptional ArsR family regulator
VPATRLRREASTRSIASIHGEKPRLTLHISNCLSNGAMAARTRTVDPYFALSDPTRREILSLLSGQERSVTDLTRNFDVSQPAISQHLKVLRSAGIVHVRKDGRRRLYSVDFARLKRIHDWVSQFEAYWVKKLDALDDYLQSGDSTPHGKDAS